MADKKLLIGSHCGLSAPDFYLGTVEEALSYGETTFMFYTGAPQNSLRKSLDELKIKEGRELIKKSAIDETKIVVHAPYIVNLANDSDLDKWNSAIKFIRTELQRVHGFGCKTLVLHPGAHVGLGVDHAIETIAKAIDMVFASDGTDVKIALETLAGKGTEVGTTFEEIHRIISLSKNQNRLGCCMDTCHLSDGGYDITDVEGILDSFDKIIGLNRLLVLHVNDSKNIRGAHKDRHENIGYGEIGFDVLNAYVNNPRLVNVPKILETPYYNEKPPYKEEIEMFKNQKFVPNWRDKI
ncbi:MAG: deoxyribonuclease IV [Erysipelotrichaceae bacterium]|nr:deoxyribonuclease IV [Erysipelotrichaceae bacterium]